MFYPVEHDFFLLNSRLLKSPFDLHILYKKTSQYYEEFSQFFKVFFQLVVVREFQLL